LNRRSSIESVVALLQFAMRLDGCPEAMQESTTEQKSVDPTQSMLKNLAYAHRPIRHLKSGKGATVCRQPNSALPPPPLRFPSVRQSGNPVASGVGAHCIS
jgi:hypothetical protein